MISVARRFIFKREDFRHRRSQSQQHHRSSLALPKWSAKTHHCRDRRRTTWRSNCHHRGAFGIRVRCIWAQMMSNAKPWTCIVCVCLAQQWYPSQSGTARSKTPWTKRCVTGSPMSIALIMWLAPVAGPHPYPCWSVTLPLSVKKPNYNITKKQA